jgi:23S rRNA A2030 N6-methylase RlmJ
MAATDPRPLDLVLDALDRAPRGEDDMTPEQHAEFAQIAAEYEAGRARLIAHENVPEALEEMTRTHAA